MAAHQTLMASGPGQPLFRLPPRPVLGDWLWAGGSAGLMLGLAELAVAVPAGSALDPRLAGLVLGIDAAVVALGSFGVGAILHARSVRLSRSGLVGAVVGPLLFAGIFSRFWNEATAGGLPALVDFSGLMTAALFAVAAGLACSRLADALERRGVVCSGLYVWGGVSVSLAISERLVHAGRFDGYLGFLTAFALVFAAAVIAWVSIEIAQRRESRSPRTFGWMLLWLVVISIGAAAAPVLLPWILYDRDVPEIAIGPPNFLIAVLPEPNGSGRSPSLESEEFTPTLERLASEGVTYEILRRPLESELRVLLIDSRETPVVPQLLDAGYATAAILAAGETPPELANAEIDAQPGPSILLDDQLAWLSAAPLLTGSARPLLRMLGLDTQTRDADRLAEQAKAWLLDWRMERAGAPFFLFCDFRKAASPPRGESLLEHSDARLGDILEHLRVLDVEDSTLVLVAISSGSQTGQRASALRLVVRAPTGWPRRTTPTTVRAVGHGQLGDFLILASRSDGTSPVPLPEPSRMP